MRATKIFNIILGSILFSFFLVLLACVVFYASIINIHVVIIALLIVFSMATLAIVIFCAGTLKSKSRGSAQGITKIALLSESNAPKEEFSLIDRTSVLIGKRDTVYFRSEIDLAVDGYAVLNCVDRYWYIERAFDERNVGLKRAGEQFVYRLKTGMSYKLQINDIIYIGHERLLVL